MFLIDKRFNIFCVLALLMTAGCVEDAPYPFAKSSETTLQIAVKSTDTESLSVWAYVCDADGNVAVDEPAAYVSADGLTALMQFAPVSRYYMLVAVAGADVADGAFSSVSSATSEGRDGTVASGWKVVDLMPEGDVAAKVEAKMDLFRTVGKVSMSVKKTSKDMRLLLTDVTVCSSAAPSSGALLSHLTPAQILAGGRDTQDWWYEGCSPEIAEFSETLGENIEVTDTGEYLTAGFLLLHENMEGWTDLADFEENGFALNPSESDTDCHGYYLSICYRYTIIPGVSLTEESDAVTQVRKYIPLSPVCRNNDYDIKVAIGLDGIVVIGNTEVSEETDGVW